MYVSLLLRCHDGDAAFTADYLKRVDREYSADLLFYLGLESAPDETSIEQGHMYIIAKSSWKNV